MQLEEQVCNLKLAKHLKELKVEQISLWYWSQEPSLLKDDHVYFLSLNKDLNKDFIKRGLYKRICSAFTVAELGLLLPDNYVTEKIRKHIPNHHCGKSYYVGKWVCFNSEDSKPNLTAETEADARARMLIYLLKKRRM